MRFWISITDFRHYKVYNLLYQTYLFTITYLQLYHCLPFLFWVSVHLHTFFLIRDWLGFWAIKYPWDSLFREVQWIADIIHFLKERVWYLSKFLFWWQNICFWLVLKEREGVVVVGWGEISTLPMNSTMSCEDSQSII